MWRRRTVAPKLVLARCSLMNAFSADLISGSWESPRHPRHDKVVAWERFGKDPRLYGGFVIADDNIR